MQILTHSKIFWLLLLLTIAGEFLVPWVIKRRYPGYKSKTMVMSVLGCSSSPVRKIYNVWLVWLGCLLTLTAFVYFDLSRPVSRLLAILIFISIFIFALGAGILSGLFSVNETKEMTTTASKIHGVGAALGFMTLLFLPLLCGILAFMEGNGLPGVLLSIDFICAFSFFTLFIMGDKEQFKNTAIAYEGLWERLALLAMYVPLVYLAVNQLFV